jgi:MinD-like ATPase involved in chromosome partitioning or flagellar assembly
MLVTQLVANRCAVLNVELLDQCHTHACAASAKGHVLLLLLLLLYCCCQVPLNGQIRHQSDIGVPIVMSDPDSLAAHAYISIAAQVKAKLSCAPCEAFAKQPTITVG